MSCLHHPYIESQFDIHRGQEVRYTPALRNLFVIFPEGQWPKGYITNRVSNIAGVYLEF